MANFSHFLFSGVDASKFLKGQVSCSLDKLTDAYQATAISNLKGRVYFGIWLAKLAEEQYDIVVSSDCAEALQAHIKKFAAFSKVEIGEVADIYPCVMNDIATFTTDETYHTTEQQQNWQATSIATGNYWITADTQELFQPQELRLHQRGGVDYDKGCYLGQEVIARIYFKSAPKAYLHRVAGVGSMPSAGDGIGENGKIQVVNAITNNEEQDEYEALVVARPEMIEASGLTVLPLPIALQEDVARH